MADIDTSTGAVVQNKDKNDPALALPVPPEKPKPGETKGQAAPERKVAEQKREERSVAAGATGNLGADQSTAFFSSLKVAQLDQGNKGNLLISGLPEHSLPSSKVEPDKRGQKGEGATQVKPPTQTQERAPGKQPEQQAQQPSLPREGQKMGKEPSTTAAPPSADQSKQEEKGKKTNWLDPSFDPLAETTGTKNTPQPTIFDRVESPISLKKAHEEELRQKRKEEAERTGKPEERNWLDPSQDPSTGSLRDLYFGGSRDNKPLDISLASQYEQENRDKNKGKLDWLTGEAFNYVDENGRTKNWLDPSTDRMFDDFDYLNFDADSLFNFEDGFDTFFDFSVYDQIGIIEAYNNYAVMEEEKRQEDAARKSSVGFASSLDEMERNGTEIQRAEAIALRKQALALQGNGLLEEDLKIRYSNPSIIGYEPKDDEGRMA